MFYRWSGSKFENNGGNFVDRVNQTMLPTLFAFPNLCGELQHFHITNGKLVYIVFVGNQVFSDKINLKVSEYFISLRCTRISMRRLIFFAQTLLHIASI